MSFVGYYSAWKVSGIALLIVILAVCPMLPGFGDHVTYTGLFYTSFGYPFLLLAVAVSLLIAAAMLPAIVRALLNRPAIEISGDTVRIFGLRQRDYPISCVAHGVRRIYGNLYVRGPDGKQFTIPLWAYRNPQEVLARLTSPALRQDAGTQD